MNTATASYSPALSKPLSLSRAGLIFLSVFMVIVFEGAVRKWVTTSVTLPLILLRDLLAIGLIVHAWRGGHLRRYKKVAKAMFAWSCLVLGWGLLQVAGGESSPILLIIGLRFWLLYLWFAVAAAASMNESDYRAAVLLAACMMLVMAPLAVLQHFSPPGAPINAQTEGDEEGVFVVVAGVVRTTGTFSFTAGYAYFMALAAPVVFGVLAASKRTKPQTLFALAVFIAFAVGALVSGSRTAVVSSALMFSAFLFGRLLFSKMRNKGAAAATVVVSLALVAGAAFFFQEAIEVTQTRFESAAAQEDFWGRIQWFIVGEPWVLDFMTWLGAGIGYGSNLATFVRTGSSGFFPLAESESGRILLEGGLLGLAFVALKAVVLTIGLFKSFRLSSRVNSPFPLLVWLTTAIALVTWSAVGQLTANGLLGVIFALALLVFRYQIGRAHV